VKKLLGCIQCGHMNCQRPRLNYDSMEYEWAGTCGSSPARLVRQIGGRCETLLTENAGLNRQKVDILCFNCGDENCYMWQRHGPTCPECDKPLLAMAILANQSLNTYVYIKTQYCQ
jgi:hypothetical protein